MKNFYFFKKKTGFTLVETVIAMLIAAITLVGFLQLCNTSSLMLKNIKCRIRVVNIAQAEIEDTKALGYDEIDVAAFTPYKLTYVIIDEGPTTSSDDDIIGEMKTTVREVVNPPSDGKKIVVTINWAVLGEPKQEIVETVLYCHQ